jgi:enoyl-CoA hydratase/carnithine racemase
MIPELASHAILPRVLGLSNAADLLMSGRMITGREAAAMGLASAAVPAAEVLPLATERAREFVSAAPVSVAITKRLIWQNLMADIGATTKRENQLFTWAGQQADAREGIESFLAPEGRCPFRRRAPGGSLRNRHGQTSQPPRHAYRGKGHVGADGRPRLCGALLRRSGHGRRG